MTRITTLDDADAVATRASREIARLLEDALGRRGMAHLALSGGATPAQTYELLAEGITDWTGVHVWFADERCVPPEHEQSNYLLARRTLLDRIEIAAEHVHRMKGELGPDQGACDYASELAGLTAAELEAATSVPRQTSAANHGGAAAPKPLPVLDVIVLGIGPDGHVASLFPGASTLRAGDQAICLPVNDSPKPPSERITLSLAVLRAARRCVLLATGAEKANAISAALAAPSEQVPASLLARERLTVIIDDGAAAANPAA